jgi:hypothetical protein|uniref:Uncharacterized protein n=1 Tax=Myoviridae sp. ctshb19 TaxID=2825194 RepID=A0A8S5UGP6_9CAUD|nr:MAG TPA: hypothetical protein [Myoviridae sp. ctshb19]
MHYIPKTNLNAALTNAWNKAFGEDRETFTAQEVDDLICGIRDDLLRNRVTAEQAMQDRVVVRTVIVDRDRNILGDYSEQLEQELRDREDFEYTVVRLSQRHIDKLPDGYTKIPEFVGHYATMFSFG